MSLGRFTDRGIKALVDDEGWWRSGDVAQLETRKSRDQLILKGRLDGAIQSGGETVFPDQLESRLVKAAALAGLPIEKVFFLPVEDPEWGQRLAALIRLRNESSVESWENMVNRFQDLVRNWLPAERPISWHLCQILEPNEAGKWERKRWMNWLKERT